MTRLLTWKGNTVNSCVDFAERMETVVARSKNNGKAFTDRMNDMAINGVDVKGVHHDFNSTQEFADFLKVSRQTLSHWLYGNRTPDMDMLVHISERLNMSIDYLVGRSENNSLDADIQAVTRCTGLSGKSIDALCNRYENRGIKFLNGFAESPYFDLFMIEISRAYSIAISTRGLLNEPIFGNYDYRGIPMGVTKKDVLRVFAQDAGQHISIYLNDFLCGVADDVDEIADQVLQEKAEAEKEEVK